jgi:hypothetical protein
MAGYIAKGDNRFYILPQVKSAPVKSAPSQIGLKMKVISPKKLKIKKE